MRTNFNKNTTETHTYQHKETEINFFTADQPDSRKPKLTATIDTPRLHMRSVASGDHGSYTAMFNDKDVVKTYFDGAVWPKERISQQIAKSVAAQSANSPYDSDFAIDHKTTDAFIGRAVLHPIDKPSVGELSYCYNKQFWNKGFGTEAAKAIVQEYAPATKAEGHLIDGAPITTIQAMTLTSNMASRAILQNKLGMTQMETLFRYGGERVRFELTLPEHPKFKPHPDL